MQFFKRQIKPLWLILLFAMHVLVGCAHTWIAYGFFPNHGGDIWYFFNEGLLYKKELLAHPLTFLHKIFSGGWFNVTDTHQPLLDVQYQAFQYLNAFLDILSFNNLYINTLLFSFPVFAGSVALFKTFYAIYNKSLPAICTLALPSVLFWTSVVNKDSLFYMAIGFFFYYLLQPGKPMWRKGFLLLICTAFMFISRANALITLMPAILFFIMAEKNKPGKKRSLIIMVIAVLVVAVVINTLVPGGILYGVSERQKSFQLLTGSSRLYLPLLEPTFKSVFAIFPTAFVNGLFQPLPGIGGQILYTAFSVELLIIWTVILFGCWVLAKKRIPRFSNFDITCLLFALPGLVIIGYMIPFAGAVVRYRSIFLPFLIAPFLNILCNYPVAFLQRINNWLDKNVMTREIKADQ